MSPENEEILRRLGNIEKELREHREEESNNREAIEQLRKDMLAQFQKLSLSTLLTSVKRELLTELGSKQRELLTELGSKLTSIEDKLDSLLGGQAQAQ